MRAVQGWALPFLAFLVLLSIHRIDADQSRTGGPEASREAEFGCPTCRVYTWVFAFSASSPNLADQFSPAQAVLSRKIESYSTSRTRILHQAALHRIGMHVLQFFSHFVAAVYVEVIKRACQKRANPKPSSMNGIRNCPLAALRFFFRKSRETRCLSAFNTTDGADFGGSLISKCT